MAFSTNNLCCELTGCLTRVSSCGGEIQSGADSTIYIAALCAIDTLETFDCANADGRGVAEIVMDTGTSANHLFYPYTARDEGVEGTITGTREDNGTYTGSNTIVGEYYGFSKDAVCRIEELKGAEVVVISCLKDGTALVTGLDGSLVLSAWDFTYSTGILTLTFTETNASLPYHLDVSLPAVPTHTTLEEQITAIASTCA